MDAGSLPEAVGFFFMIVFFYLEMMCSSPRGSSRLVLKRTAPINAAHLSYPHPYHTLYCLLLVPSAPILRLRGPDVPHSSLRLNNLASSRGEGKRKKHLNSDLLCVCESWRSGRVVQLLMVAAAAATTNCLLRRLLTFWGNGAIEEKAW